VWYRAPTGMHTLSPKQTSPTRHQHSLQAPPARRDCTSAGAFYFIAVAAAANGNRHTVARCLPTNTDPSMLLYCILAHVSFGALPPGYEDEAWCPPGSCLRDVLQAPGMMGPQSASKECFDASTATVTQEVWTGSLSNQLAPDGWVKCESTVDPSFSSILCPEGGPYGLPSLPDQFETWVTCNIVNKNYTVVIHEVYDAPGNRALFTRYHADNEQETTLYLYSLGEYFHFNSSHCNGGQVAEAFGPMRGQNGHIAGTAEFFRFATEGQEETYLGIVDIEGVPCEHFQSTTDGGPNGASMKLDYYFSAPGWQVPESHASRVPVLLNLSGSRPQGPPGTPLHFYHHYYSFGHFTIGAPRGGERLFTIPTGVGQCTGNITSAPYATHGNDGDCEAFPGSSGGASGSLSGGSVFGLCFLFFLFGVGAACIFVKIVGGGGKSTAGPVVRTIQMPNAVASSVSVEGGRA
jgi:hypothetical protein